MEDRDRSEGWRHAKLSGHENEVLVTRHLIEDPSLQFRLLKMAGIETKRIRSISVGGLNEEDVESVFHGYKTKSKTDICIEFEDGSRLNVSLKKSLSGQVYEISDERFIKGFELQYGKTIPKDVKRAINLLWGPAQDVRSIIDGINGPDRDYEERHNRLVANSLKKYDVGLYDGMLGWLNDNMPAIVDFCFSKGCAKNSEDWAHLVWYRNELGEHSVDEIFPINKMCRYLDAPAEYGKRNGGTTIQLPFGFVQWHQGCMQFHHKYRKIKIGLISKA